MPSNKTKTEEISRKHDNINDVFTKENYFMKIEKSINKISEKLDNIEKKICKEKNFDYIFRVLDCELSLIIDDIQEQDAKIEENKNHISKLRKLIQDKY